MRSIPTAFVIIHSIAFQFHRPDLDEGLLLIFRRAESPYRSVNVTLKSLDPKQEYELESCGLDGRRRSVSSGAALMSDIILSLPDRRDSDLIVYRRVDRRNPRNDSHPGAAEPGTSAPQ